MDLRAYQVKSNQQLLQIKRAGVLELVCLKGSVGSMAEVHLAELQWISVDHLHPS